MRRLLETCREYGVFDQDDDEAMALMGVVQRLPLRREAQTDPYNTDMVLEVDHSTDAWRGKLAPYED